MNCWKCGKEVETRKNLSFRAMCSHCHSYLHVCKNCIYYSPGLPNDCKVPETEPVADRAMANFCEEFSQAGKPPPGSDPKLRDRFNSLFKD